MRIREVGEQTGLSRKTIRFYESKGLLDVQRTENDYREYTAETVARLRQIALFRRAGLPLSDIQLWADGVIDETELLQKRLHALRENAAAAADQVKLCNALLSGSRITQEGALPEDGEEETDAESSRGRLCLGIDIGTTTISAVVLCPDTGRAAGVYTIANGTDMPAAQPWEKTQDAVLLLTRVRRLTDSLLHRYPAIDAIGFTGQMHGIVYLDGTGAVCSPLYTWQDGRADAGADVTPAARIHRLTGWRVPAGYGLATHYALSLSNAVPPRAARLCTIMDAAALSLTGGTEPVCHATNAASLGFWRLTEADSAYGGWDIDALCRLGISPALLPRVTETAERLGTYRGIPVYAAIGDNQASYLGAMVATGETADGVLVNFGTGSQITRHISAGQARAFSPTPEIEVRPYVDGGFLQSGSALCGGRAYACLERFFRAYAALLQPADGDGGREEQQSTQYERMNRLAAEEAAKPSPGGGLHVVTTFCGTRSDAGVRGSILGIGDSNLTPGALVYGTLCGMAEELHGMFLTMTGEEGAAAGRLVVSGNAARKNPALREVLRRVFGRELCVPPCREEAAFGAACFAAGRLS